MKENITHVQTTNKHDPELWEIQGIDIIANNYYDENTTGAQAVLNAWKEIEQKTLETVAKKMGFPDPLGVVHAINTLSKNLARNGALQKIRDDSTPWR